MAQIIELFPEKPKDKEDDSGSNDWWAETKGDREKQVKIEKAQVLLLGLSNMLLEIGANQIETQVITESGDTFLVKFLIEKRKKGA